MACLHLRVYLEMNEGQSRWWLDRHPGEREVVSDGTPDRQSLASTVWRDQAKAFLRALVAYLKTAGLFERVVAYRQPQEAGGSRLYALVQAGEDGDVYTAQVVDESGLVYVELDGFRTVVAGAVVNYEYGIS